MKPSPRQMLSALLLLPLSGCLCLPGAKSASGETGRPSAPSASSGPAARTEGVSLRALWTVSRYLVGQGSAWSEQQARSLLFKPLDMTPSAITFDGRSCKGVHFQRQTVAAAPYLQQTWQVTPEELGIEERQIEVVRTDCTLPGFREYLRLKGSRLVIEINGTFFYFEPVQMR